MVMQMIHAGGFPVLSDGLRGADEDNPRGYLEYEPVRRLMQNSAWLSGANGKAVKIVAPLLGAIPKSIPCRVILIERDIEEILDSQAKMIERRGESLADSIERRETLKTEYARTLARTRKWLSTRPGIGYLILDRSAVLAQPAEAAARLSEFLGGLNTEQMAAAVDPSLHRNRRAIS